AKDANGDRGQNQNQKRGEAQHDQAQSPPNSRQHARELPSGRLPAAETVSSAARGRLSAENRYIVRFADGTSNVMSATSNIAAAFPGVVPTQVYRNVFQGFAAVIP